MHTYSWVINSLSLSPFRDPIEETKEIAAIIVQRLLRGRSSQLRMYQGKERRMHLIHELRARKAIDSSETVLVQTEKAKQSDIVIANVRFVYLLPWSF